MEADIIAVYYEMSVDRSLKILAMFGSECLVDIYRSVVSNNVDYRSGL